MTNLENETATDTLTEEEIAAATMDALKTKLKKFALIGAAVGVGAIALGVIVVKLKNSDLAIEAPSNE